MVKQQVDEDASNADVDPEGPGPAGEGFVPVEASPEGAGQGEDDESTIHVAGWTTAPRRVKNQAND